MKNRTTVRNLERKINPQRRFTNGKEKQAQTVGMKVVTLDFPKIREHINWDELPSNLPPLARQVYDEIVNYKAISPSPRKPTKVMVYWYRIKPFRNTGQTKIILNPKPEVSLIG